MTRDEALQGLRDLATNWEHGEVSSDEDMDEALAQWAAWLREAIVALEVTA